MAQGLALICLGEVLRANSYCKARVCCCERHMAGYSCRSPCHCTCADWLLNMQSSREELLDDIEELKKKVTGASDKLSS